MQKTFFKFVTFDLVERVARFRLLLEECGESLHESSPVLYERLKEEAAGLEASVLAHKPALNKLFSDNVAGKQATPLPEAMLDEIHPRLCELSRLLLPLRKLDVEAETYLFLKDVLPHEWLKEGGEQTVFLQGEGAEPSTEGVLSGVLIDALSVLQKNNPLAWVGLADSFARQLVSGASVVESLKLDAKKVAGVPVETLLVHGVNLRLMGPAYYFHALTEAVFRRDERFFQVVEPALFYGLNHLNFTHKSLVIVHEACERSGLKPEGAVEPAEETLAAVFRAVEKLVPSKYAFQEKHLERAIHLQERLNQGTLLSSTPLYPVEEVVEKLNAQRQAGELSIYDLLSQMTEYPHTPREIVNAGWLHKVERGPVWLYATLNEENQDGFERLLELVNYQDHLLRKSIETSEVHRVLLCNA